MLKQRSGVRFTPLMLGGTVIKRAFILLAAIILCDQSVPAFAHEVDLTKLPLGDGKLSSAPAVGQIWACRVDPNGGGAQVDGPWINKSNGTFDFTKKAVVSGHVVWTPHFVMTLQGDMRIFTSNDLPNHPTGSFPIPSGDDAYRYDRNPNAIKEQTVAVSLPANPLAATQPLCAPGAVGILLTGSVLFNALDAPGRDAVAHETQDSCQGPSPAIGRLSLSLGDDLHRRQAFAGLGTARWWAMRWMASVFLDAMVKRARRCLRLTSTPVTATPTRSRGMARW